MKPTRKDIVQLIKRQRINQIEQELQELQTQYNEASSAYDLLLDEIKRRMVAAYVKQPKVTRVCREILRYSGGTVIADLAAHIHCTLRFPTGEDVVEAEYCIGLKGSSRFNLGTQTRKLSKKELAARETLYWTRTPLRNIPAYSALYHEQQRLQAGYCDHAINECLAEHLIAKDAETMKLLAALSAHMEEAISVASNKDVANS